MRMLLIYLTCFGIFSLFIENAPRIPDGYVHTPDSEGTGTGTDGCMIAMLIWLFWLIFFMESCVGDFAV